MRFFRFVLSLLILLFSLTTFSQIKISGTILNQETGEPVSYAYIKKKHVNRGAITNEDGYFELLGDEKDTLIISFVSYEKKEVPFAYFSQKKVLKLSPSINELTTIDVFANFDFLYTLFEKARKNLKQSEKSESKTYFSLETTTRGIPVELVESYYNAEISPSGIDELYLKNGRIGMSELDEAYFTSLHTTSIISDYNLLNKTDNRFPNNPLHLTRFRLKKIYALKLLAVEGGVYKIQFTPKKKDEKYFESIVWIDFELNQLIQIKLSQESLKKHPFLEIDRRHQLDSIDFDISYTFSSGDQQSLEKVEFQYNVNYTGVEKTRRMNSQGVFLFFDKEHTFDLPYYTETQDNLSDYDKIVSQPYNKTFWQYNEVLNPSKKSLHYRNYFEKTGVLLNFDELSKRNNSVFKNRIVEWSENRLLLSDVSPKTNYSLSRIRKKYFSEYNDFYELTGHIYLDRNMKGDSAYYHSKTLIDLEESYYFLEENKNTMSMINTYFDLIEIGRIYLMETLNSKSWTKEEVDSIYISTQEILKENLRDYLIKVRHGDNEDVLKRYNKVVLGALNIDNNLLIWSDFMVEQIAKRKNAGNNEVNNLYNYGTALLQIGKYKESLSILLEAYYLGGENDPWLVYNIGINYLKLGEEKKGCEYLVKSKLMGEQVASEFISQCE